MKHTWYLIIPLLLIVMAVAVPMLEGNALWYDEFRNAEMAGTGYYPSHGLKTLLKQVAADHAWPPAYYLITAVWGRITGPNLFLERLPSLLFGLLAIAALYRLGASLFSAQIGLIAATLLSTSAFYIFYLSEMRGYTLYILSVTLLAWCYHLLLQRKRSKIVGISYFFILATVIYTHYVAAVIVISVGLYHLIAMRKHREYWYINVLTILGLLLYAPWSYMLLRAIQNERDMQRASPLLDILSQLGIAMGNGIIGAVLIVGLLFLALRYRKIYGVNLLYAWILITIFFTMLINIYTDFLFHPRHLIGILPPIILLMARVLVDIPWKMLRWSIVIFWMLTGLTLARNDDFMNATIPNQIRKIPLSFFTNAAEDLSRCALPTDGLIFILDNPYEEWIQGLKLGYYFPDYEGKITVISKMLNDNDTYERVTRNSTAIWVFQLIPADEALTLLDDRLENDGFTACSAGLYAESCADVACVP